MTFDGESEKPRSPEIPREDTAGQTLRKLFRQTGGIPRVQEQPAAVSLLMSPPRLSIFLHLFAHPCDHTRSIARKVDCSLGSTSWNLGQLYENGYIESSTVDMRRAYWPAGMLEPGDAPLIGYLGMPWCMSIFSVVHRTDGGARQRDLTAAIGESQQTTEARLRKLVSIGLLESSGEGRARRYRISARAMALADVCEARTQEYSRNVWNILRNDGLMPAKRRLRGTRLSADIMLPTGRRRIHLECNPASPLTALLAADM